MTKNRFFVWMWMLSKRLYKKPAFMILLLLIPLLVLGYASLDKQDSGAITIALTCEDPRDPAAAEAAAGLLRSSRLIRFISAETPEEAVQAVAQGNAHAAWIFRDQMQARMQRYVQTRSQADAFIRVVQREESVMLRIAREKLGGTAYSASAETFSLNYIRRYIPSLDSASDADLKSAFREIAMDAPLFEFETVSGREISQTQDLLDSPLRGLLGVVAVMGALASEVYCMQDEKKGLFSWIPQHRRPWMELGYQLISVFHMSLVLMLSLWASGIHGTLPDELAALGVFSLTAVGFSLLVRTLCRSASVLTAVLPVVMILMIAVCPIFYDLPVLEPLQLLLPPTYWIRSADARLMGFGLFWGFGMVTIGMVIRLLTSGCRNSVSDAEFNRL